MKTKLLLLAGIVLPFAALSGPIPALAQSPFVVAQAPAPAPDDKDKPPAKPATPPAARPPAPPAPPPAARPPAPPAQPPAARPAPPPERAAPPAARPAPPERPAPPPRPEPRSEQPRPTPDARPAPTTPPSTAPTQQRRQDSNPERPRPGARPEGAQPRTGTPPTAAPSATPAPSTVAPSTTTPPAAAPSTTAPATTPPGSTTAPGRRPEGERPRPGQRPGQPGPRNEGTTTAPPAPPTPPAAAPGATATPPTTTPPAPPAPGAAPAPGVTPGAPQTQITPQRSGTAGPQSKTAPTVQAPTVTRGSGTTMQNFRDQRRETRDGNRTVITEPGRTIIRDGDRTFIRRDENARFEINARNVRTERRGTDTVTIVERPDGSRIVTMTDTDGRLLRRLRRDRNNRDVVIIDNTLRGPPGRDRGNFFVNVPPPRVGIPRERYIVEAQDVDEGVIYETFMAPPLERMERSYSLDEVRYSPALRDRMRRVDVDTINFETGSWEVSQDGAGRLKGVADAIMRAVQANPNEVFMVEGHTDAVGPDLDNLSLSDRRAESVALILSEQYGVPPENLTTQGYGEQFLKVNTQEAERTNRRVTVRRITPLLGGQAAAAPPPR